MTYEELLTNARPEIGKFCKVCPVCNGKACKNQMPGPGAKGVGDTAIRNYDKWQEIRINMDTLSENKDVDTTFKIFGREFKYPFFAGPVGAVNLHYGEKYNDASYNDVLVSACAEAGIAAMTGDGVNAEVMRAATEAVKKAGGLGIPTVKPWNLETVQEKMKQVHDAGAFAVAMDVVMRAATEAVKKAGGLGIPTVKPWNLETVQEKMKQVHDAGAFAVAMDVDAAGLPFLKNMTPPAGRKSVEELHDIVEASPVPFIVKGVMTVRGALKAEAAGASAIVVSNHGGRVLDQCPATAEVLEDIVAAVKGKMKIFVDGGIRSGVDVFKALALGADGVIIARPFVTAVYGGGAEGVKLYVEKLGAELADTMAMCGANSLEEITRDMIWK